MRGSDSYGPSLLQLGIGVKLGDVVLVVSFQIRHGDALVPLLYLGKYVIEGHAFFLYLCSSFRVFVCVRVFVTIEFVFSNTSSRILHESVK